MLEYKRTPLEIIYSASLILMEQVTPTHMVLHHLHLTEINGIALNMAFL
jgi:hypothetical protein